ncbi:MAG: hypothetical protein KDH94_02995, partial [Coxiellaceae bacterium]|nr:hypothetical protein [Coxiellaceae bacterium]
MNLIFKLMWFDKKTEEHVGEIVITHLFSEKELMELVNEKEELCDSYRLSKTQFEHIAKKTLTPHSEKYNYYLDISGDYTLDLRDCVWIPAPASEFTDKDPIDRLDAEKAFLSHDPEKIIDAL